MVQVLMLLAKYLHLVRAAVKHRQEQWPEASINMSLSLSSPDCYARHVHCPYAMSSEAPEWQDATPISAWDCLQIAGDGLACAASIFLWTDNPAIKHRDAIAGLIMRPLYSMYTRSCMLRQDVLMSAGCRERACIDRGHSAVF